MYFARRTNLVVVWFVGYNSEKKKVDVKETSGTLAVRQALCSDFGW